MKLTSFLKEKLYFIILGFALLCFITLFLSMSPISKDLTILIDILYVVFLVFVLFIEYKKRYLFYHDLQDILDSLDKKYLITEIIEEPTFLDGKILYECLSEISKNMQDEINTYKIAQQEYKEYVEMWVHEIKTPLASSNLILDNHPSLLHDNIKKDLKKVESFVEQALFYAKSNSLEKDYMIKKLLLSKPIHQIIKKHSTTFIYQHISVELNHLDQYVYADIKWLEFILDQIISNALKYSKENGKIIISAIQETQNIKLFIEDNGIGISAQDLPNVFQKGFTGINGRIHEKSTGIGLYLCKKLCEKMYLNIQIESIQNQGTTVIIIFPKSTFYHV